MMKRLAGTVICQVCSYAGLDRLCLKSFGRRGRSQTIVVEKGQTYDGKASG
ncbi:hypothetical protein PO124_11875 [Bacillus licheniformis]|nr:hypothetical protein [Bacillus licheniformis]